MEAPRPELLRRREEQQVDVPGLPRHPLHLHLPRPCAAEPLHLPPAARAVGTLHRPSSDGAVAFKRYTFLCTALVWSKRLPIARVALDRTRSTNAFHVGAETS